MADTISVLNYAIIAVATASLLYGSYTDVKKRTVKALLFVPLMALGAAMNILLHAPYLFLALGVLIFLFTFLEPDTYAYGFLSAIFIVVSAASLFLYGFYWGFQLLVISVVYALGFTERLFGIGDIKGIIAVMFASTIYSPLAGAVLYGHFAYVDFPTSLSILVDVAIFSVIFLAYAVYLSRKHGAVSVRGEPLAIKYNSELAGRNPQAYKAGERDGVRYMAYRIPFMVAIFLGYILFVIMGSPIFL